MLRTCLLFSAAALIAQLPAQGHLPGVSGSVRAVVAGDLDGDADPDLVFAVEGEPVRVLRNDGSANFSPVVDAAPDNRHDVRDLVLFDADGDGDLDLALACYRAPNLVYANDGHGKFALAATLDGSTNAWTTSVACGDFDGDGDTDLVFGNLGQNLELYVRDGAIYRHAPRRISKTKAQTAALAFGDIDGDGDLDLLLGNRPDAGRQGGGDLLFLGDGKTLSVDTTRHGFGRFHTTSVALADVDGDGDLDAVCGHSNAKGKPGVRNTVHLFEDGRFGTGSKRRMPNTNDRTRAVALGDIDGDGDVDVVFANAERNAVCRGDGTGRFSIDPDSLPEASAAATDVVLADFNRDGHLDVVFASDAGFCTIALGDGTGRFEPPADVDAADPEVDQPVADDTPTTPVLVAADDHEAEREAFRLAGDASRAAALVDSIDPEPSSDEAFRAAFYKAIAIERMGWRASSVAESLLELLDEARLAKSTPRQQAFVAQLFRTVAAIGPYAQADGFVVDAALLLPPEDDAGRREFARARRRLSIAPSIDAVKLEAALRDGDPFVRELAAEFCIARETRALHQALLDGVRASHPNAVRVELPGGDTLELTLGDTAFVADRMAKAAIAIDSGIASIGAHDHALTRAAARWHGPQGAMLRRAATRSARHVANIGPPAAACAPALESILDPGFPLALGNPDERELVEAALGALAALGELSDRARRTIEQLASRPEVGARARAALGATTAGDASDASSSQPDLRTIAGGLYAKRLDGRKTMRSRSAANAIELGLEWLAAHQSDDGRWDADEFMRHDTQEPKCTGPGDATQDVGLTGLALLCFLADGHTIAYGRFGENVARAADWLAAATGPDGALEPRGNAAMYGQAIGTLALVEAYGMSGDERLGSAARRAVDYLVRARHPSTGWRYEPNATRGDTSVTAWCANALATARDFGLDVPDATFASVREYLSAMTDANTGRVGYDSPGAPSARRAGDHAVNFPPDRVEALTAAAIFTLLRCGERPNTFTLRREALLAAAPPDTAPQRRDMYYWFWGSHALRQLGGDAWDDWQKKLVSVLVPLQQKNGAARGSWNPDGVWGGEGGRIYATALAVLSLGSAHRYDRAIDHRWRRTLK